MMCNFITHQIFCTLSFTRKNKLLILIELDRILKSSDGPKPKNFDFWVLKNHQLLSNSQKQSIRNCLPDLGGKSACLLSRVLVDHAKKFSVLQKEELQQCEHTCISYFEIGNQLLYLYFSKTSNQGLKLQLLEM